MADQRTGPDVTAPTERDDSAPAEQVEPTAPTLMDRSRFATGRLILGRYKISGKLGRGGMGVVLRCRDEVSGIDVAVKALPPELSYNADEMEQIRSNFQLVHRLHHPNIAGIHTLEQDIKTGDYYLIMEYVAGISLRKYKKNKGGALSLEEARPIVDQVAAALDYAHSQKVIHRDIKPGNILIAADGTVKVLDFGVAAQLHSSLTRVTGGRYQTSGTAPYMAPEQWRGEYQDAATDEYVFAVTVYELLAGRVPFDTHDFEVLRGAVLHTPAPRIPELPGPTWRALARALAKNRKERFDDCAQFACALLATRRTGAWVYLLPAAAVCAVVAGVAHLKGAEKETPAAPAPDEAAIATVTTTTVTTTTTSTTTTTTPAAATSGFFGAKGKRKPSH